MRLSTVAEGAMVEILRNLVVIGAGIVVVFYG